DHHHGSGVRVLLGHGIVVVTETYALGQRVNLRFLSGEKMPALICSIAAIAREKLLLLGRSILRTLLRIYANAYHVKFFTDIEFQDLQRAGQPALHLAAQHRAGVINQRQNDRLVAEVLPQLHWVTSLVTKLEA